MSDTEIKPHLHPYSRDLAESLAKTLPLHLGMTAGRHGYWLYFTRDQHIGPSLEHYGEWTEVEHQLFRKIVKPGMIVLEAGSNIGTLTVPLAKLAGVEGRVGSENVANRPRSDNPDRCLGHIEGGSLCSAWRWAYKSRDIANAHVMKAGFRSSASIKSPRINASRSAGRAA